MIAASEYSSRRLPFGGKTAEIPPAQLSNPTITIAVPINSVNIVICLPIKLILRVRGVAQIRPTVVQAVAVFVVDLTLRPIARHPEPSEPRRDVEAAVDPNDEPDVSFAILLQAPDRWASIFAGFSPLEMSGSRIVV